MKTTILAPPAFIDAQKGLGEVEHETNVKSTNPAADVGADNKAIK